jgi:hypothetical protein
MDVIRYESGAEGGSTPDVLNGAQLKAQRDLLEDASGFDEKLNSITGSVKALARDTNLADSMGVTNIPSIVNRALGLGDTAWQDQTRDQRVRAVTGTFLSDILRLYAPVSDTDLSNLLKQLPAIENEPGALWSFMYGQGRAKVNSLINKGKGTVAISPRLKGLYDQNAERADNEMRGVAILGAVNSGLEPTQENFEVFGVDNDDDKLLWRKLYQGRAGR